MLENETAGLTQLGSQDTIYPKVPDCDILEVFKNKAPNRKYEVKFECPEFTSLCPKTKQPDFAHITIQYVPKEVCIESKSLKLYLFAFRNYGSFMEHIVNKICDDLVAACKPRWLKVIGNFNARGGIGINVMATYFENNE